MPSMRTMKSIFNEYGAKWLADRTLYSMKLKGLTIAPITESWYEKETPYPTRLDVFQINVEFLRTFLRKELRKEDQEQIITIAEKASKGIIRGFSSIELDYGYPIDWQLNPITGKRCKAENKWYTIPDFDEERGDIKIIWEASRFSHFITLARAYLLTDDLKYYHAFSLQLAEWLEKNPYSFGANYKCSQECSLRMVNTLLAFTVFRNCRISTDADASNVKDLVDRCYRKVLSNFFYAYKCIKNNHTISELVGMIVGAWCCNDIDQMDRGYNLLDKVINEQFTEDGGYCQFSFNYQRLVLQDLEVVLSIEEKTGRSLSNRSKEKIQKAYMLMFQCQDDTGDMPNYGNNDGALVFPVSSCDYRDFRPVINAVCAILTGHQLYDAGIHQEELIWFSAGKELDTYTISKTEKFSSQFPDAGLFTLRGECFWAMIVSNDYHSRPAHMDQMHFDLWIDGVNVFCDAGTFSYASEEGRKLAGNESHNTSVAEGKAQMNSSGPFMIYDWAKRKLGPCDGLCFTGECVSANGYKHIRQVKQIGASYEISDQVDKDYKIYFHTPCEVLLGDGEARLLKAGKVLCTIRSNGKMKLVRTIRSLYYLQKEEINCLVFEGQARKENKTTIIIHEGEKEND